MPLALFFGFGAALLVGACASENTPSPNDVSTSNSSAESAASVTTQRDTSSDTSTRSNTSEASGATHSSGSAGSETTSTASDSNTSSASETATNSATSTARDPSDATSTSSQELSDDTPSDSDNSQAITSSSNDSSQATDTTTNVDPETPITIWLAGDSTVANGNTPCPTGWGKHLSAFFNANTTVRNSAVGGRSVRTWMYDVLTTMDAQNECELRRDDQGQPTVQSRWQEMLDKMKPGDALLIQFGINDGSATCDRHVGLEAFKQTYGVLAQAAKERGAQPVFLTPVSSIACNGSSPRGSRGAYVDATIDAGEQYDVPVLELHGKSVERYAELGFCPVQGGDVSAQTTGPVGDFFCDDHTHFSEAGAQDIASLVVELLLENQVSITSHLE